MLKAYQREQLAREVTGGKHDFGLSDDDRPLPELDLWRQRVRICDGQQWRRVRTNVRRLLALGTGTRQAILIAPRSKGDWHLSKTRGTPSERTEAWWLVLQRGFEM
jgi:RNA-directed DNA polymerase